MEEAYSMCKNIIDAVLEKIDKDVSIEDIKEYLELKKIEVESCRKKSKDESSEYIDTLVKSLKWPYHAE